MHMILVVGPPRLHGRNLPLGKRLGAKGVDDASKLTNCEDGIRTCDSLSAFMTGRIETAATAALRLLTGWNPEDRLS